MSDTQEQTSPVSRSWHWARTSPWALIVLELGIIVGLMAALAVVL